MEKRARSAPLEGDEAARVQGQGENAFTRTPSHWLREKQCWEASEAGGRSCEKRPVGTALRAQLDAAAKSGAGSSSRAAQASSPEDKKTGTSSHAHYAFPGPSLQLPEFTRAHASLPDTSMPTKQQPCQLESGSGAQPSDPSPLRVPDREMGQNERRLLAMAKLSALLGQAKTGTPRPATSRSPSKGQAAITKVAHLEQEEDAFQLFWRRRRRRRYFQLWKGVAFSVYQVSKAWGRLLFCACMHACSSSCHECNVWPCTCICWYVHGSPCQHESLSHTLLARECIFVSWRAPVHSYKSCVCCLWLSMAMHVLVADNKRTTDAGLSAVPRCLIRTYDCLWLS